jgi:hypothetical protein
MSRPNRFRYRRPRPLVVPSVMTFKTLADVRAVPAGSCELSGDKLSDLLRQKLKDIPQPLNSAA